MHMQNRYSNFYGTNFFLESAILYRVRLWPFFSIIFFFLLLWQTASAQPAFPGRPEPFEPKLGGQISLPDHDAEEGSIFRSWYIHNRDRRIDLYYRGDSSAPSIKSGSGSAAVAIYPNPLFSFESDTGDFVISRGGIQFEDGTVQSTKRIVGPKGPTGDAGRRGNIGFMGDRGQTGDKGLPGSKGDRGPPVKTFCILGGSSQLTCGAIARTIACVEGAVTSDAGWCMAPSSGRACICAP